MVDVTKCIGCRKGIYPFVEKEEEYFHMDLFAEKERGAMYPCENTDSVGDFLVKNDEGGTYVPNPELSEFLRKQDFWWDDIIRLTHETLKDPEKIAEFFNQGGKNNRMWCRSNKDIEDSLIDIAEAEGFFVDPEDYPDLIKFNLK